MYRPAPTLRDRAGPLFAVLLLHAAVGFVLLRLSGTDVELVRQADLAIFDVALPPPPPPPPPMPEQRQPDAAKPRREEAAAAPPAIASRATPVVVPQPRIVLPAPSPVVAATTPSTGAAPTQGASSVAGPGTGAGGTGTGTGSGGTGAGDGGGGTGLGEARARLVSPALTRRDYPDALFRRWPPRAIVFIILRVGPDGVPVSCRVARSFGDGEIDAETCRLAVQRLRFEPGRDERGRPVADFVGYRQEAFGRY